MTTSSNLKESDSGSILENVATKVLNCQGTRSKTVTEDRYRQSE